MEEVVVLLPGNEADGSVQWEGKFIWDRSHVLELIKEYRNMENEFKDHTIKRKVLWRKISQNMKKNGVRVSWELCDKKWRNLKQTFKSIHTSKRSGISMRRWEFYSELQDIFKDDPNIKSQQDTQGEIPDDVDVVMPGIDSYLCSDKEINEDESKSNTKEDYPTDVYVSRLKIRECGEAPVWFQEFMTSYREDEKATTAMVQKMLKDVVRLEERKCELLELLCEKIDENSF